MLEACLSGVLASPPEAYVRSMADALRELVKLVQDFKQEDEQALAGLDAPSARILLGKRLASLQALLSSVSHPDVNLVEDIKRGFPLTGMAKFSGTFTERLSAPSVSVQQLRSNAEVQNTALLARTRPSGDQEADRALWQAALEESEAGWLSGPFWSVAEVEAHLGQAPLVSRRFPLAQRDKLRAIDDLSESGVNAAFGCCDKLWLMDGDACSADQRSRTVPAPRVRGAYPPGVEGATLQVGWPHLGFEERLQTALRGPR